jgi:hypothetical protein
MSTRQLSTVTPGLEDVLQRHAFARDHVPPLGPAAAQLFEQPSDLLTEVANIHGDEHA